MESKPDDKDFAQSLPFSSSDKRLSHELSSKKGGVGATLTSLKEFSSKKKLS